MRHGVALLSVGVALAIPGCGGKLTADETEAKLFEYTAARSIECKPGGDGWDYFCDVVFVDGGVTELGVDVDGDSVTEQTAP